MTELLPEEAFKQLDAWLDQHPDLKEMFEGAADQVNGQVERLRQADRGLEIAEAMMHSARLESDGHQCCIHGTVYGSRDINLALEALNGFVTG